MPLRDHLGPPIWNMASWEGFHGGWPMTIAQKLVPLLPPEFTAESRVHLGTYFEIDVCAYEDDELQRPRQAVESRLRRRGNGNRCAASAHARGGRRPERAGRVRGAGFRPEPQPAIGRGDRVSIVDLVTIRRFNLYSDLLDLIGRSDPALLPEPPATYAVTCRGRKVGHTPRLESWAYPLVVGQPLPALPVWLTPDLAVSLDLEASYEETCRVLRTALDA